MVHGGKTVYAKGFGVKDNRAGAADTNKVGPDTVFQLASVSKPLSATVVAHQVGEKAIGWDTPVTSKLPWFALSDPAVTRMVTIGDLFSHRSGLPDHAGDLLEDIGYDRRQVLERLRQLPLDPFRISYAYTNYGLTAGAEAVAAAAGTSWDQLGRDVLFSPLGMSSTSYRFADYEGRKDRAVGGHIRIDGGYQPEFVRDADQQAPAGGVSSSVNDMTHWLEMVLANGSYQAASSSTRRPCCPRSPPRWCPAHRRNLRCARLLRFRVQRGRHLGGSHPAESLRRVRARCRHQCPVPAVGRRGDRGADQRHPPSGVPEALTAEFADLVQFGSVREDWYKLYTGAMLPMGDPVGSLVGAKRPANPAPAQPLPSYVGTYRNDYWGPAVIAEKNGKLALTLGPRGDTVELTHWDGNTFTFSFISENSPPPGSISKAAFDGGKLTLEYYDEAVFTK